MKWKSSATAGSRIRFKTGRAAWWVSAAACVLLAGSAGKLGGQAATAPTQAPVAAASTGAQDLAGIWQGTLHIPQANRDLRTEIKIAKDASGAYKTVFYSVDQTAPAIPANKTTFENGSITFTLEAIGGKYEGKMSPDGKTLTGTFTQGPSPLPLVLERVTEDAAWPIPEAPKPMAADANPGFDVATIKPNDSGATRMQGLVIQGRKFVTRASSLEDLIGFGYNVQAKQIIAEQPWMASDRYDIEALPDVEGVPNVQQVRTMIQKLLADRFKLTFHHEQREMSAYVLEVRKSGNKLTPDETKGNLPGLGFSPGTGGLTLNVRNGTMDDFAGFLQILVLDRPVVNKTGLTAKYDFKCTFAPDDTQFSGHPPRMPAPGAEGAPAAAADTASAPSLYEALEKEDGLKLTAEKTMVDVLVIDHVEKPSAN